MMLMHEATLDLVDQEASVVPGGAAYLDDLERRLAPYFERAEPRQRAMAYLRGLLSPVERKNSWQLAEVSGAATPYAFQHLLRRALWDPEAVRHELCHYIVQHLGAQEAVLVLIFKEPLDLSDDFSDPRALHTRTPRAQGPGK